MRENIPPKKFVDSEDLKTLSEEWRTESRSNEPAGKTSGSKMIYGYQAFRFESDDGFGLGKRLKELHGESIIHDVIPRLLGKLPRGKKLKILDNGGGAGLLTDQIRREFGDRVEVCSTGLSKQAAREYRKRENLPPLHKDDLKWRSIQELSDYPEFGLIIDTYDEQYYRSRQHLGFLYVDGSFGLSSISEWYKHIGQVTKKLLPGGYATIAPVCFATKEEREIALSKIKEKFKINAYWGPTDTKRLKSLKIEKLV
jgi:hypothetical protein